MTRSRWAMCAGGLLLGCGARVADHTTTTTTSPGAGGAAGASVAADGGSTGAVLGVGSPRYVSTPDGGTSCTYAHFACDTFDSYVDLFEGTNVVRLRYPGDPDCGLCSGRGCDLYTYAREACGVTIHVSACAGPDGDPPCIDTASDSAPYYIDPMGKRWGSASLTASSLSGPPGPSTTLVDVDGTLTFWDAGQEHYERPAHVHLCASVLRLLLPC